MNSAEAGLADMELVYGRLAAGFAGLHAIPEVEDLASLPIVSSAFGNSKE